MDSPISFTLTPCEFPLVGTDKRGEEHPAWLIPNTDPYISDTFIIVNDPAGYRYDPDGLSPSVRVTHPFWKNVGQDEWVCGPDLTYRKGDQSRSFATGLLYPQMGLFPTYRKRDLARDFSTTVTEDSFETRRLPDGGLLIKTGPRVYYSEFGSGECGACPRTDVRVFAIDKDLETLEGLELGNVVGHFPVSQDFTVSPDWSEITEYDLKSDETAWSSTTWCRDGHSQGETLERYLYKLCDEKANVKPPNPPVLKEARYGDN